MGLGHDRPNTPPSLAIKIRAPYCGKKPPTPPLRGLSQSQPEGLKQASPLSLFTDRLRLLAMQQWRSWAPTSLAGETWLFKVVFLR